MQRQGVLHLLLFVIFFGIGAGALGIAVLCDDLVEHCRSKNLVQEAESSLRRLESLNTEYDVLIEQLENDPNLLKRIAPVTLGAQPEEPCAVYPKAKARELAVARKALLEQADQEVTEAPVPRWLRRCSEPAKRVVLFIAGAGLVLISLVCFTSNPTEDA